MKLEGKSIVVRDLTPQDEPALVRVVAEMQATDARADLAEVLADAADGRRAQCYAIALKATDEVLGVVSVDEHPDLNETELRYYLCGAFKGCGYTKEAVTLLSDHCLAQDNLPYLVFVAGEGDASAGRVAEKCGFTLYEKRVTVGHRLTGIAGDVYYYYRKY